MSGRAGCEELIVVEMKRKASDDALCCADKIAEAVLAVRNDFRSVASLRL
jgi:hypothetical protein